MMDAKYRDMLHMEHPVSKKHPQMSMHDRAAQFSPFAALTGYEDAITETGRLTGEKLLFEETQDTELERTFRELYRERDRHPLLECRYFRKDSRKEGGEYISVRGTLKKMDVYEETLLLDSGVRISFSDISELTIL